MSKTISKVWTFPSDSNTDIEYETLQYIDGTCSCNCKGWTRRVAADGARSCKHTRYVDMGTADRHCVSTHHYDQPRKEIVTNAKHTNNKHQNVQITKLGCRKFAV